MRYSLAQRLDQNSDFGGNLTPAQLKYCANDVLHLHKIHDELNKILIREKRLKDIIASEENKFWKVISRNTKFSKNLINLDKRLFILERFFSLELSLR